MSRQMRLFAIGLSFSALILFVPITLFTLDGDSGHYVCGLSNVEAQDNPCLAQAATITALELQIRDDRDAVATILSDLSTQYEATITALQSEQISVASDQNTVANVPSLPFYEDFSTNNNGWDFFANDRGIARLSQGKLVVNSSTYTPYWIPIPGIQVDEFYIEIEVSLSGEQWGHRMLPGFAIGDFQNNQLHMFVVGFKERWEIIFYEAPDGQPKELFNTSFGDFWGDGSTVILGLESQGGLYTLFVNDTATDSITLNSFGNEIALAVGGNSYNQVVLFDNLEIRAQR